MRLEIIYVPPRATGRSGVTENVIGWKKHASRTDESKSESIKK